MDGQTNTQADKHNPIDRQTHTQTDQTDIPDQTRPDQARPDQAYQTRQDHT